MRRLALAATLLAGALPASAQPHGPPDAAFRELWSLPRNRWVVVEIDGPRVAAVDFEGTTVRGGERLVWERRTTRDATGTRDEFTWMALDCGARKWKTVRHMEAVAGELRSARDVEDFPWTDVGVATPGATILDRACAPPAALALAHARALRPTRLEYAIHGGAPPVGTAVRTLAPAPGGWVAHDTTRVGEQERIASWTFTPELAPAAFTMRTTAPGEGGEVILTQADDRLRGSVGNAASAAAGQRVDLAVPAGTYMPGAEQWLLAAIDPMVGQTLTIPVFDFATGTAQRVVFRVDGTGEVEVPAGSFQTYHLSAEGGVPLRIWIRREAPHLMVRQDVANGAGRGGATIVLTSVQ